MEHEEIGLLRNGFVDIYKRVDDLETIFEGVLKTVKKDDIILTEGDNGALPHIFFVDDVCIPEKSYLGRAKIPFLLNNRPGYGLGGLIKIKEGTLREVVSTSFKEPTFEKFNIPTNTFGVYSDFKVYLGNDAVDEQLHSRDYNTTIEKYTNLFEKNRDEKRDTDFSSNGNILRTDFEYLRARIDDLSTLSRDVIELLDEGDELQIDNSMSGAQSYSGIVKKVCLPPETYKGPPAIPFVLDEYGLGIRIEFEQPINRGVIYSDSILSVRKRSE